MTHLTLLAQKLINLNKLHQRKHINSFPSLSLTTKPLKLFDFLKIVNHPDIIKLVPCNLQKKGSIPTVTYKPGNITRNKILNYKDVNSIYVDEEVLFSLQTNLRDCENQNFVTHITYIL